MFAAQNARLDVVRAGQPRVDHHRVVDPSGPAGEFEQARVGVRRMFLGEHHQLVVVRRHDVVAVRWPRRRE